MARIFVPKSHKERSLLFSSLSCLTLQAGKRAGITEPWNWLRVGLSGSFQNLFATPFRSQENSEGVSELGPCLPSTAAHHINGIIVIRC